jgi:POLQ-like helicase
MAFRTRSRIDDMIQQNSRQLARIWPHQQYKRDMRQIANAWFVSKGLQTNRKWSFCLANHDMWPKNVICPDVVDYIQNERKRYEGEESFPLHRFLHHGLSSQAMVFNLIGPLIVRNDLDPLKEALNEAGMGWPVGDVSAGFEYADRTVFNEVSGQPTSIDLVVSGNGPSIFIECKLVEKEFGGCSVFSGGDCDGANPLRCGLDRCYLHHIGRKYWDGMKASGFAESKLAYSPTCPFISHYQFFREALFALAKGGVFMLLHDERSPVFVRTSGDQVTGLWPSLMKTIPDEFRDRFGKVTIQQVASAVEKSGRHGDWIGEFKKKYGLA